MQFDFNDRETRALAEQRLIELPTLNTDLPLIHKVTAQVQFGVAIALLDAIQDLTNEVSDLRAEVESFKRQMQGSARVGG